MARRRRRARRRLRPRERHLRAVRRLLRARAAGDRGDRAAAADRRRPAARGRADGGGAGAQAGRRADAPPPGPRRGRAGLARPEPRLLRAANRARQLALAGDPRGRCSPARAATGDALDALRIAGADRPRRSDRHARRAASTSRRWAASGRRSRFGFAGVRPRGDRLVVEPHLPPEWNALELALRFRGEPLRLRIDRDGVDCRVCGVARPCKPRLDGRSYRHEDEDKTVLAAADNSLAGRPVIATALRARGRFSEREVEAVHVATDGDAPRAERGRRGRRAAADRLRLRRRASDPRGGESADVVALAIGARGTPGGRRPLGGTAAAVATSAAQARGDRSARRGRAVGAAARARPARRDALGVASRRRRSSSSQTQRRSTWWRCTYSTRTRSRRSPTSHSTSTARGRGSSWPRYCPGGLGAVRLETRVGRTAELVAEVAEQMRLRPDRARVVAGARPGSRTRRARDAAAVAPARPPHAGPSGRRR